MDNKKFGKKVEVELRENRLTYFVYITLRFLVVAVMILQILNRNYENVFLCILTLILMIVPSIVQATFKIELPTVMETVILFFIFSAEILGEISEFYIKFQYWDTIMHTLNGFLCAAIGFSLVDLLNRQKKQKFELSPLFMAIVAFCFSMTIGVLWEFFEFGSDILTGSDMQKDTIIHTINSSLRVAGSNVDGIHLKNITDVAVNGKELGVGGYVDIGLIDTMEDLFVNFIGALTFSIFGFFYNKGKKSKKIVDDFVPQVSVKDYDKAIEEMESKRKPVIHRKNK